jgi:FtsH-binding integral membrane protein
VNANDRNRSQRDQRTADVALRLAIVALTLGTAYIHSTLGGTRFTLNAIGYVVWAAAIVAPFGIARRHRALIRLGLMSYAAITIVAWAVEGTYYATAYEAKAIEVALITVLAIDLARHDGNPIDLLRRRAAAGRA